MMRRWPQLHSPRSAVSEPCRDLPERRKVVRPQLASLGPTGICGRSTLHLGAARSRRSGRTADLIGAT